MLKNTERRRRYQRLTFPLSVNDVPTISEWRFRYQRLRHFQLETAIVFGTNCHSL